MYRLTCGEACEPVTIGEQKVAHPPLPFLRSTFGPLLHCPFIPRFAAMPHFVSLRQVHIVAQSSPVPQSALPWSHQHVGFPGRSPLLISSASRPTVGAMHCRTNQLRTDFFLFLAFFFTCLSENSRLARLSTRSPGRFTHFICTTFYLFFVRFWFVSIHNVRLSCIVAFARPYLMKLILMFDECGYVFEQFIDLLQKIYEHM